MINIFAEITGIKYRPFLCKQLKTFELDHIGTALSEESTFLLKSCDCKSKIAVSWWVSPKRTRSYPYARVYDSLGFQGKKATIIPVLKDEGKDGDRDFLQWDTVSLMSLLNVYVIISHYNRASISAKYKNKVTDQKFDLAYVKNEIEKLLSYQSDALHWNLSQINRAGEIGLRALESYAEISRNLGIKMHSENSAKRRIKELLKGKERFIKISRSLARKAQKRESVTIQPKEKLAGTKATLTIKNYLGGYYFFTCDEAKIDEPNLFLIEGKHTRTGTVPSLEDIKDGLLKMILFTNLKNVRVEKRKYNPVPILKLTGGAESKEEPGKLRVVLNLLKKEAETNRFRLLVNDKLL